MTHGYLIDPADVTPDPYASIKLAEQVLQFPTGPRAGPYTYGSYMFMVAQYPTPIGALTIRRSSDGITWTEQDAANRPSYGQDVSGSDMFGTYAVAWDGSATLYIAYVDTSYVVSVAVFDMATSTWTTGAFFSGGPDFSGVDVPEDNQPILFLSYSNSRLVLVYQSNAAPKFHSVSLAGSWSSATTVFTLAGSVSNRTLLSTCESTAGVHCFAIEHATNDQILLHRSIDGSNALGTEQQLAHFTASANHDLGGYPGAAANSNSDGNDIMMPFSTIEISSPSSGFNDILTLYVFRASPAADPSWTQETAYTDTVDDLGTVPAIQGIAAIRLNNSEEWIVHQTQHGDPAGDAGSIWGSKYAGGGSYDARVAIFQSSTEQADAGLYPFWAISVGEDLAGCIGIVYGFGDYTDRSLSGPPPFYADASPWFISSCMADAAGATVVARAWVT